MKIIFILINLMLAQLVSAQDYDKNMQDALLTWQNGNAREASAAFGQIAEHSTDQWLPNYYVALVNATESFKLQDYNEADAVLQKAQKAITTELDKSPENTELMVVQALIYTGYLAKDPMMNGAIYYPKVVELYDKALALTPDNPRVVSQKAMFDLNSAKYMGGDTQASCTEMKRAEELFAEFKNDQKFYPDWGKDQLVEALKNCQ